MKVPAFQSNSRVFVKFSATFEASLIVIAVALSWLTGVRIDFTTPTTWSLLVGVVATLPMIGFYYLMDWVPNTALQRIQKLLLETLGQPLSKCRWHELLLLAVMAGLCEEVLFRGVIQPWLSTWSIALGWIGTNLLFGLAHAVTPMYFILASLIGCYLSAVNAYAGNLIAPILAHALYDWFAFHQIGKAYLRRGSVSDTSTSSVTNRSESDSSYP